MFTFPHFVQSFVLNDSKGIEENSLLNVLFTCERIWELGVDARGVCVGAPSWARCTVCLDVIYRMAAACPLSVIPWSDACHSDIAFELLGFFVCLFQFSVKQQHFPLADIWGSRLQSKCFSLKGSVATPLKSCLRSTLAYVRVHLWCVHGHVLHTFARIIVFVLIHN